ncbi:MAG: tryptophan--tRNA ligase [Acidimicrobiia bacterium]
MSTDSPRTLSAIQPTGGIHLGNYLGALRNWVIDQHTTDAIYCIADLHALTVPRDPRELHEQTIELASALISIGLDPDQCTLFVQSHNADLHTQLGWLMECTVTVGELQRMTQFKAKGAGKQSVTGGLLTYPALMAADILVYNAERVPVGEDQRQHVELARDAAERFNNRYGNTFVVPAAVLPPAGARVMDLEDPTRKMSKSSESANGTVYLFDDPASIEKKIRRAVTDSENVVAFDPVNKPGVSNLLAILGGVTDRTPEEAAVGYSSYGQLKNDVAEAVVEALRPIQERHAALSRDSAELLRLLDVGALKAREVGSTVVDLAKSNIGLVASGTRAFEQLISRSGERAASPRLGRGIER